MIKYLFILLFLFVGNVHAAKLNDFKAIGVNKTGNSATFGADLKAFPSVGNLKPNSESGWYPAGNYGVAPTATGPTMSMGANGDVFFADGLGTYKGVSYPFKAKYDVPVSTLADVVAAAAGGPIGIAVFALPFVAKWLADSGGSVNPDGSLTVATEASTIDYFPSGAQAECEKWRPNIGASTCHVREREAGYAACFSTVTKSGGPLILSRDDNPNFPYFQVCPGKKLTNSKVLPSLSDIAPYLKSSQIGPDGRVIPDLLSKGADIPMPAPTVTGPASVTGPETTTQNPDGTKTVEKTTYNFKTEGNTVTNTSNTTTTTVINVDNSIKSTTTTTVTPSPTQSESPTDCEKMPDSIGCSKFGDVPIAEKLNNKQQEVQVTPVAFASSASCPAPISFEAFGQTYQLSYQPLCDQMALLRWLILAVSAFISAWILANSFKV